MRQRRVKGGAARAADRQRPANDVVVGITRTLAKKFPNPV